MSVIALKKELDKANEEIKRLKKQNEDLVAENEQLLEKNKNSFVSKTRSLQRKMSPLPVEWSFYRLSCPKAEHLADKR